jgi:hypothetical protein
MSSQAVLNPQVAVAPPGNPYTALLEQLLPERVAPVAAFAEARMLLQAKTAILESGDFISAAEIAQLAGYSPVNPSAQPNRWKRNGAIFAIPHRGSDYFPYYGLDPDENYRPRKAMGEVLSVFKGVRSGWGLAFWFAGLNSLLDGRRPQDLLRSHPARVVEAARDEMLGILHG